MDKPDIKEVHPKLKRIAFDPRDEGAFARLQIEIDIARLVRRQEVAGACYLPELKQLLLLFKEAVPPVSKPTS